MKGDPVPACSTASYRTIWTFSKRNGTFGLLSDYGQTGIDPIGEA
jgi:hypothetical protein